MTDDHPFDVQDADGEDVTPSEPPSDVETKTVTSHDSRSGISAADADTPPVLVVKDCEPWTVAANEQALDDVGVHYRVVTSSELSDVTLSEYDVVVFPSTQPSYYYRRLEDASDRIESFVDGGGTLVAHMVNTGWPCTAYYEYDYVPGGLGKQNHYDDHNATVVDEDHPVADGITDSSIDGYQTILADLENVPASANTIIENAETGNPTYVEYSHGDGTVLATGHVIEWPWYVYNGPYGEFGEERFLRNELEYATGLTDDGETVSAEATTLSYIPGEDEDSIGAGAYGHPLNSAVIDVFEDEYVFDFDIDEIDLGWLGEHDLGWDVLKIKATPPFDAWGTGDEIESLPPENLEDATEPKQNKYQDEFPGEAHKQYRISNTVEVSFDADSSGTIDDESVAVTFDGDLAETALEAEEMNTLDAELIGAKERDGSYYFEGGERPRMWNQQIIERDGVEAVQVSTIFGGYTKVAAKVMELATQYDDLKLLHDVLGWEFSLGGNEVDDVLDKLPESVRSVVTPHFSAFVGMLSQIPNIFTFLEFTVFADGRRVVRLWDASMFPRHALYLDGERFDATALPYQPRERLNVHFLSFLAEASTRLVTPYYAPEVAYKAHILNNAYGDAIQDTIEEWVGWVPRVDPDAFPDYSDIAQHGEGTPVIQYGETAEGADLSDREIDGLLPGTPLWPFD